MDKRSLLLKFISFDVLAALIVWLLFMVFRKTVVDTQIFHNVRIFIPNYDFVSGFIFFPLSCLFVHSLSGFYRRPERQTKTVAILTTFVSSLIVSIVIFFVLMIDDIVVSYEYYYYSLLVLFGLMFFVTLTFRLYQYFKIRNAFRSKRWTINTLIIGTGKKALKMAQEIEQNAEEYTLKGFIHVDNQPSEVPRDQVIGYMNGIGDVISKYAIKDVIISLDTTDEHQLFRIINAMYSYEVDIRFTPRLYEILTGGSRIRMMGTSPLVNITNLNMPDWQFSIKRYFDIVFSLILMLLSAPVLVYFMIKIKADSPGPVFYLQERVGYLGKPFKIIKFRTMYDGSENGVPQLSSANDDRITPLGRMMRKYRIDELPQLINILKGDMSVVGPRPERKFFIDQIIEEAPYYCLLYKIRPGLTSWGPIRIGYSDTIEKMIERLNYDIIYLDNMSLTNDFKILAQTVEIVFKGKGV
ncbi:MAG: sugar transferase [Paludibacter sp.]|jgi:exopolysaccharide biosynthesis polyprenyl glycosylphosphotransferase|nr:sugar transferase [Paludibacter sp.]